MEYIQVGMAIEDPNRMFISVPEKDGETLKGLADIPYAAVTFDKARHLRWLATELLGHLSERDAEDAYEESCDIREELLEEAEMDCTE